MDRTLPCEGRNAGSIPAETTKCYTKYCMTKFFKEYSLYIAWIIAVLGVIGSLYFSEVKGFTPCVLCWYERIALYPLIILLPIGILRRDKNIFWYTFPLASVGFLIALYQNLLYYGIIPEKLAPCVNGISCTTKYINYFGFIGIPLLALIAFTGILLFILIYKKND